MNYNYDWTSYQRFPPPCSSSTWGYQHPYPFYRTPRHIRPPFLRGLAQKRPRQNTYYTPDMSRMPPDYQIQSQAELYNHPAENSLTELGPMDDGLPRTMTVGIKDKALKRESYRKRTNKLYQEHMIGVQTSRFNAPDEAVLQNQSNTQEQYMSVCAEKEAYYGDGRDTNMNPLTEMTMECAEKMEEKMAIEVIQNELNQNSSLQSQNLRPDSCDLPTLIWNESTLIAASPMYTSEQPANEENVFLPINLPPEGCHQPTANWNETVSVTTPPMCSMEQPETEENTAILAIPKKILNTPKHSTSSNKSDLLLDEQLPLDELDCLLSQYTDFANNFQFEPCLDVHEVVVESESMGQSVDESSVLISIPDDPLMSQRKPSDESDNESDLIPGWITSRGRFKRLDPNSPLNVCTQTELSVSDVGTQTGRTRAPNKRKISQASNSSQQNEIDVPMAKKTVDNGSNMSQDLLEKFLAMQSENNAALATMFEKKMRMSIDMISAPLQALTQAISTKSHSYDKNSKEASCVEEHQGIEKGFEIFRTIHVPQNKIGNPAPQTSKGQMITETPAKELESLGPVHDLDGCPESKVKRDLSSLMQVSLCSEKDGSEKSDSESSSVTSEALVGGVSLTPKSRYNLRRLKDCC